VISANERNRLLVGPEPGEQPAGILVEVAAECEVDAGVVLNGVREVWGAVLDQPDPSRLTVKEWTELLPQWFVDRCGPEIAMTEALRRRALPMEERLRLAEEWSLGAWVHWLSPAERSWAWWSAQIDSSKALRITVVVTGLPFPSGSLRWLLKCCGATSIDLLND
jgi:hypothetical protein